MPARARIMAVDDSTMNLMMIEEILGEEFDLLCLTSAEEALANVVEWRPDLVLMDIMMPGIGGYEACRRLREHAELRHLKIILVSAKIDLDDRLKGYEMGADDYVTKPFDGGELLAKVRVFLRLKTAEEMNRLKQDILRLLNHETRTPLNGLLGNLEVADELRQEMDGTVRELLHEARESGRRLASLLERCLMYGNLVSGVYEPSPEVVDLAERVASATRRARLHAERAEVSLVVAADAMVPVAADAKHLDFVADALLTNAIDHSPPRSAVEITVTRGDEMALASVRDHGPGVDPVYRPYLFEAFVPQDIAHHSSGSGLSLAIVRKIVESAGGTCEMRDARDGGACFEVRLPLAPASQAGIEDDALCTAVPAGGDQA